MPPNPHFQKRRTQLRRKLKLANAEAFLVTNIVNVRYLTGFSGSAGWLLVLRDRELLLSDSRYETQIADQCPDLETVIRDATATQLKSLQRTIESAKLSAIRYEADSLTKSQFDQLESALDNIELVGTTKVVEALRAIKDKSEIAAIRKSIRVNQKAFEVIRAQMTPDQTELEIAHNLENQMRKFGASGTAFDSIIAAGPRSALPHAYPNDTRIGDHKMLLVDWGACVDGYASDLTRVLVTAKIPPKLRKIYDIVLAAQRNAIKKIRPGVDLKTVDNAARKTIDDAGYGKFFGHGLGHSFGLEIHETPFLSPIHEGTLETGMIVTIEPGIYLPQWGGVRIEDDVLVTQNGHEVLSDLPKQIDECVLDFA